MGKVGELATTSTCCEAHAKRMHVSLHCVQYDYLCIAVAVLFQDQSLASWIVRASIASGHNPGPVDGTRTLLTCTHLSRLKQQ